MDDGFRFIHTSQASCYYVDGVYLTCGIAGGELGRIEVRQIVHTDPFG